MTVRGTADARLPGPVQGRLIGRLLAVLLLAVGIGLVPVSQWSPASQWSMAPSGQAVAQVGPASTGLAPARVASVVAVGRAALRQVGRDLPDGPGPAVAAASWVVVVLVGGALATSCGVRSGSRRTTPARGRGPPAPGIATS